MYIPIGTNCHSAMNLNLLKLRTISLPFDWLLVNPLNSFEYLNNLINTNFSNFTKNLIYNNRNKVISENYPYSEFFHYDLIKNSTDKKENENENLIDMMNRRGERFMNIITDDKLNIIFLNNIIYDTFIDLDHDKFYNDIYLFENNKYIKCDFKVIIYLMNDDIDFNLDIPTKYYNLKKIIFTKYIKDTSISKNYGNIEDFNKLLQTFSK